MHHIPHTGDLPNTVFTTAHSAMIIEPQNYLEGDPSRATTQQIRVVYGDSTTVKTFGAEPATCLVDPSQLNPDPTKSRTMVRDRAYLYDPKNMS